MTILLNAISAITAVIIFMPSGSFVLADDRHVSSLDSTVLFPDAYFRVNVDASTHSSTASSNQQTDNGIGRVYGKASVYPAFIQKLQQATGKIVNLEGYSHPFHDVDVEVQTSYLTESSVPHVDCLMGKGGIIKLNPLEESTLTAFYVHESTAEAHFETDDDELCIPCVKGRVIYFNGGLPHHTILKSGSGAVKLVGPFQLSTLKSVGIVVVTGPSISPSIAPSTPTSKASKSANPKATKSTPVAVTTTLQVQEMKSGGSSVSPLFGLATIVALAVGVGSLFFLSY
eukprot:scaffold16716_cov146-Skeletonema_dohrnii-CCMP3373.AAC.7